jgi:formylglycine-generating enzyme required for sulfatase activity
MRGLLCIAAVSSLCGCEPGLTAVDSKQAQLVGGSYLMGSSTSCTDTRGISCAGDRVPHPVKVSAFALDVTEVSQLQYASCVQSGQCPPQFTFDADHKDEPALVDDPAAARAYCAARGLRLPTEAEFEFASRIGPDDQVHKYPWGDDDPGCDRLAFAGCGATRAPAVGTVAGDVSAAGIHDLAGSVPEWVEDSYVATSGCVDRLGYAELCWGKGAGCPAARCAGDGMSCATGCLPASEDVASTAMGGQVTSTPVCLAPQKTDPAASDPVEKTPSGLGVIRGGSFADGRCALAGYTRRHAEPRRVAVGFRCARSTEMATMPTAATSYRFSIGSCSATATASVKIMDGDKPADYTLDVFPSSSGKMTVATAMSGVVDQLPCDGVFVVHPTSAAGALSLTATIANGPPACQPMVTSSFDLTGGGDLPVVGTDELEMQCGG